MGRDNWERARIIQEAFEDVLAGYDAKAILSLIGRPRAEKEMEIRRAVMARTDADLSTTGRYVRRMLRKVAGED